jgi:hypothetical protein
MIHPRGEQGAAHDWDDEQAGKQIRWQGHEASVAGNCARSKGFELHGGEGGET